MIKSDLNITEEVIKKQLKEGKNPKNIYKEAYEFTKGLLETEHSCKIQEYNKQVSDGISSLSANGCWVQLSDISKHALTTCVDCLQKEETTILNTEIAKIKKFKLDILSFGKKQFLNLLTEEAKNTYFGEAEEN